MLSIFLGLVFHVKSPPRRSYRDFWNNLYKMLVFRLLLLPA